MVTTAERLSTPRIDPVPRVVLARDMSVTPLQVSVEDRLRDRHGESWVRLVLMWWKMAR